MPKFLKKVGRYSGLALLSLLIMLALGYVIPRPWSAPSSQPCERMIYVSSDNFHTNLILPMTDLVTGWQQRVGLSLPTTDPIQYLVFGWGERTFYVETPSWEEMKISNALKALFWSNAAAMNVYSLPEAPQSQGNTIVKPVWMTEQNYRQLLQFIQNSFQLDRQGQVMRIRRRNGDLTNFFEAHGRYSILTTCNSWTAEGLRAAQIKTPLWGGLASAVMWHLADNCQRPPS